MTKNWQKKTRKTLTKAVVWWCSIKKVFIKTSAPKSPFNKVESLKPITILKRDSGTGVFCEFCVRTPIL